MYCDRLVGDTRSGTGLAAAAAAAAADALSSSCRLKRLSGSSAARHLTAWIGRLFGPPMPSFLLEMPLRLLSFLLTQRPLLFVQLDTPSLPATGPFPQQQHPVPLSFPEFSCCLVGNSLAAAAIAF